MSLIKIRKLAQVFPGDIGVYAKNLNTGEEVSYNADVPFYLASVSKVLIMIGAVDLMNDSDRLSDLHEIEMYDYREEGKHFRYHHIGTQQTYQKLLQKMISISDTTATDMVVRIAGQSNINERLDALGIEGISPVTSIGNLDHIVVSNFNDKWASVPAYAMESQTRTKNTEFLIPYYLDAVPASGSTNKIDKDYRSYYRTGLNSATPRAMGKIIERLAEETLLDEPWKNDALRNDIFSAGGRGTIGPAIPDGKTVDSKGGGKHRVKCALGVSYNANGPEAVIGVFTQNLDIPRNDAIAFITEAANLAYRAVGFSHTPTVPSPTGVSIQFTQPTLGRLFDIGVTPEIRWSSSGISGRLSLFLLRTNRRGVNYEIRTISTNVIDDGAWNSFNIPSDIEPGNNYRFKLVSIASDDDDDEKDVEAYSSYFAVRGVIKINWPALGTVIARGDTPKFSWETRGVSGRLTIELFRDNTRVKIISTNVIDDGEWHSWTASDNQERDDNYRIKVTSNNDQSVVGWSQYFTIGGEVKVSLPAPAQILDIGDTPRLQWSTENVSGNVKIDLFRGETDHQKTISDNALNDGEWHSTTLSTDLEDGLGYRIKVTDKADSDIYGTSQYFQIGSRIEWLIPSVEQAQFDNKDHARRHYFACGETPNLTWRTIGHLEGNLEIRLLQNGIEVDVISENARNDGEWHSWEVPTTLPAASNYQLKLVSKNRSEVKALSQPFHLGALIDIARPYKNRGVSPVKSIRRGDKPQIKWRTENITGRLKLELLNLDTLQQVIASDAIDDGEWHSWTVPDDTPISSRYRFRLSSKVNENMFALSPWFSIKAKAVSSVPT